MQGGHFSLFVGLGNPGAKYNGTRHNVGFQVLEELAKREDVNFKKNSKVHGYLAEIGIGSEPLRLLMPNTYMNQSGLAIRAALDWFSIDVKNLLVIVDDLDLPLGRLRLRAQGSAGGHNGLRSTINHIGTQQFSRLRIGIGSPSSILEEKRERTIKHVLGNFSNNEKPLFEKVLKEVVKGLNLIQDLGLEKAANQINTLEAASFLDYK